jgi:hypothetical protein
MTHDLIADGIIGIFSGIISSVAMIVYLKVWTGLIKPWWQKMLYRDVLIDGKWIGDGEDKIGKYSLHIHIKQIADKVTGVVDRVQENKIEMAYQFHGIVRNSILNIRYSEHDRIVNRFDSGNFIGKIEQGGTVIKGILSYLSNIENDRLITISDVVFYRVTDGRKKINGFDYMADGDKHKK